MAGQWDRRRSIRGGNHGRDARVLHAREEPAACEIAAQVRVEIASTHVYAQSMHFASPPPPLAAQQLSLAHASTDRLVESKSRAEG